MRLMGMPAEDFFARNQENEAVAEQRASTFDLAELTKGTQLMKLADDLMGDHRLQKAAFVWWEHNQYALTKIDEFLKQASRKANGKNYDEIHNGYLLHRGYTGF
ncbi:RXLR domain-containing protein [Phytophthora infestans]|uniref:RXLR domain-containing protein n=1 Tax=Phytophthora infestans TaxID=4787 RepID=A0A833SMW5_PHYIN|nr:RXLR domain-containing protein [Phytophthora infestans]KAF4145994.1 RXLR effector domain-containing protein [Phytophthora infestans]KAI9980174.1 hypothetical protein PInf_026610 [Phytophthora infestans]KAI9980252.1 hypothetical protein PInf_026536 [Phytophthora infestans]